MSTFEATAAAASTAENKEAITKERAAHALSEASRVVILSGAGMSQESGINTFRDPEVGVWKNKLALMWFGTPIGWKLTPGFAFKAYGRFWQPIGRAQPNDGHRAISRMPTPQGLDIPVEVITQNVDNLHQRAGTPSDKVYEVHGTVFKHRCIKCEQVGELDMSGWAEHWPETNPKCAHCGAGMRPDAVLFGEGLPGETWEKAMHAITGLGSHDVLLIIGTSGSVYPAASLPEYAHCCIIEINPMPSGITHLANLHIALPSAQCLPQILDRAIELKRLRNQQEEHPATVI